MATKTDFSADEWKQIGRAPLMAGLAVVAASPSGPFGVVKEMFAMTKVLADVKAQGASNELVKSVVADLETGNREQSAPAELKGKTPEQVKTYAIENCRQVVALVDSKAKPQEAQEFKQWLVAVATGRRGCEGRRISGLRRHASERTEAATIKELSTALAVKI